jgi:hypothetical protein
MPRQRKRNSGETQWAKEGRHDQGRCVRISSPTSNKNVTIGCLPHVVS